MSEPSEFERLVEERRIERVLIAYCRGLDAMDLESIAALFTDDCVVSYGPDDALNSIGREALRSDLARLWRWQRTAHHLCNIEIEFERADAARAQSAVMAWHERTGDDGALLTAIVYGRYEDILTRTDAGWRIASRTMFMAGSDANFRVNLHPAPRRPPPPGWTAPDVERRD